jgi:hypothetical protein
MEGRGDVIAMDLEVSDDLAVWVMLLVTTNLARYR